VLPLCGCLINTGLTVLSRLLSDQTPYQSDKRDVDTSIEAQQVSHNIYRPTQDNSYDPHSWTKREWGPPLTYDNDNYNSYYASEYQHHLKYMQNHDYNNCLFASFIWLKAVSNTHIGYYITSVNKPNLRSWVNQYKPLYFTGSWLLPHMNQMWGTTEHKTGCSVYSQSKRSVLASVFKTLFCTGFWNVIS